jgi:hypothetical protein
MACPFLCDRESNGMNDTDELWADGETGEVYAVRLEENRVMGYCGPLGLTHVPTPSLNESFTLP